MRLFWAIDVPPAIKEQAGAARAQLARGVKGVKWVENQNLHLTLKFLGEVAESQVPEIIAAARTAMANCAGFNLSVGAPGFFPNANNPRVIWLAIEGQRSAALRIGQALDDSLIPWGFQPDKKRRLHLTLGRVRSDSSLRVLLDNCRSFNGFKGKMDFEVDQAVLYRSELTIGGPVYSPVEKFVFNS